MGWDECIRARDNTEASAEDRGDTMGRPGVNEVEITYFSSGDVDGWIRREGDGVGDSRRRGIEARAKYGRIVERIVSGDVAMGMLKEAKVGRGWSSDAGGEWEGLRHKRLCAWE